MFKRKLKSHKLLIDDVAHEALQHAEGEHAPERLQSALKLVYEHYEKELGDLVRLLRIEAGGARMYSCAL